MPETLTPTRLTFVLLHGAWHGGWCWRWVASTLRLRGHRVSAPTLTGRGEHELAAGHDAMVDTPVETASLLEAIARSAGPSLPATQN